MVCLARPLTAVALAAQAPSQMLTDVRLPVRMRADLREMTMAEPEQIPRPDSGGFPFRSTILALITVQSAFGLVSDREIGGLIAEISGLRPLAKDIDYFGTIIDAAFLAYGSSTLLNQAGLVKEDPTTTKVSLNGLECQVTLNIGREPGTWMAKARGPCPTECAVCLVSLPSQHWPHALAAHRNGPRLAHVSRCRCAYASQSARHSEEASPLSLFSLSLSLSLSLSHSLCG
jgi:hypothetical protein